MIIGGSTKCGTTSLFNYFSKHPQVCPSNLKETRYFLFNDYQSEDLSRTNLGDSNYDDLFMNCGDGQFKLEATPDYLYSRHTADAISKLNGNVKLVFILRDPVDRLFSWFKYASMNGLVLEGSNINSFIEKQDQSDDSSVPQHYRSLKQGVYSNYLTEYYKKFKSDNILIVFFEDLQNDPIHLCTQICEFAGLNKDYFAGYNFRIHNRSTPVRSLKFHKLFRATRRGIRSLIHRLPKASHKKFKFAGHYMATWYQRVNERSDSFEIDKLSESSITTLRNMYEGEADRIKDLCGENPQWSLGNSS